MRRFICVIASALLAIGCCSTLSAASAPRSALAALAIRLPEVKFDGTRMVDAIDYLREVSDANFHVNWKAMEAIGVTRDTPVTFTARQITLRKALSLVLAQSSNPNDLSFYNDGGVIEITTKAIADNIVITRLYDVQDLLIPTMSMSGNSGGGNGGNGNSGISSGTSSSGGRGSSGGRSGGGSSDRMSSGSGGRTGGGGGGGRSSSGSRTGGTGSSSGGAYGGSGNSSGGNTDPAAIADDLIAIITSTIEPNIWMENGGTSSIRYFHGNLIITAPRRIHELIGGTFE